APKKLCSAWTPPAEAPMRTITGSASLSPLSVNLSRSAPLLLLLATANTPLYRLIYIRQQTIRYSSHFRNSFARTRRPPAPALGRPDVVAGLQCKRSVWTRPRERIGADPERAVQEAPEHRVPPAQWNFQAAAHLTLGAIVPAARRGSLRISVRRLVCLWDRCFRSPAAAEASMLRPPRF